MAKRVFGVRGEPDLIDELGGDQLVDNRVDVEAGQQVAAEARPDDRCGRERVFVRRAEPVDAGGDGRLQGGRHADVGDIDVARVATAFTDKYAAFGQVTGDLLGEKGVT